MRFLVKSCISSVALCAGLAASQPAKAQTTAKDEPAIPRKKLIEYGWDRPTPEYVRDHIAEMEKRPFDGVMFILPDNGGQVFNVKNWNRAKQEPQLKVLADIKWNKFTDNFLTMYSASTMDWFSDSDWKIVLDRARFCARAAKVARCKGLLFDPEPYGDNPWHYSEQKHANQRSYEEYTRQVRLRGGQFMRALSAEMPVLKFFMFYQYSMFQGVANDPDPAKRDLALKNHPYGLMKSFLDGMLDAAGPGVQFIDGNEPAYYYKSPLEYYRSYHGMRSEAKKFAAPELAAKFDAQVRAGQALWADYVFNILPNLYPTNVATAMTPEEREKWFLHNSYYALKTSDEYVWLYSQKMNWWKGTGLPEGLERSLVTAHTLIDTGAALPFDLSSIVDTAQQRIADNIKANQVHRSATITKITAAQRPQLDGKLDDALYREVAPLEPFLGYVRVTGNTPPLAETRAWVTYDDENLYIAFSNSEPQIDKLQSTGAERDSTVWQGDSVEISIRPDANDIAFYHFILSPKNVQWEGFDRDKVPDLTYNPQWKTATHIGTDAWTVEAAIPWRDLKMTAPAPGTSLRVNLARKRTVDAENTSWSQFIQGFQEPENFGEWKF